ncbi:hypothetical protein I7I53_00600 [Histoplasma capsulatum var. duboisii H88]|uniref:Uncharacterized protein n=1 Tax=Ajellomyces capsulatus (strain H88) TaxID=544711 RepID=A0A8A1LH33_AJEC8|nr:hypothetical protein I7I53_00600 [Histoplasma capsulatum var. duboisii H88]
MRMVYLDLQLYSVYCVAQDGQGNRVPHKRQERNSSPTSTTGRSHHQIFLDAGVREVANTTCSSAVSFFDCFFTFVVESFWLFTVKVSNRLSVMRMNTMVPMDPAMRPDLLLTVILIIIP